MAWIVTGALDSLKHDIKFVMLFMSKEGSFVNICLMHANLVLPKLQIELVNIVQPWSSSKSLSTVGMGKRSLITRLFKVR